MKKTIIMFMIGVMTLTSCGTIGAGALTGTWLGGSIGSAIGGVTGGRRGSDLGRLIGMAVGASTGAVAGAAVEAADNASYNKSAQYDTKSVAPSAIGEADALVAIENARFINQNDDLILRKGETAQISFELRNVTDNMLRDIVPTVTETTKNKRILVSEPIRIEALPANRALRFTANVSTYKNVRKGTAHFSLCVKQNNSVISDIVEFDVAIE